MTYNETVGFHAKFRRFFIFHFSSEQDSVGFHALGFRLRERERMMLALREGVVLGVGGTGSVTSRTALCP